jgi:Tfp pilus assembly protein PilX
MSEPDFVRATTGKTYVTQLQDRIAALERDLAAARSRAGAAEYALTKIAEGIRDDNCPGNAFVTITECVAAHECGCVFGLAFDASAQASDKAGTGAT